jgi:hypothetical protein
MSRKSILVALMVMAMVITTLTPALAGRTLRPPENDAVRQLQKKVDLSSDAKRYLIGAEILITLENISEETIYGDPHLVIRDRVGRIVAEWNPVFDVELVWEPGFALTWSWDQINSETGEPVPPGVYTAIGQIGEDASLNDLRDSCTFVIYRIPPFKKLINISMPRAAIISDENAIGSNTGAVENFIRNNGKRVVIPPGGTVRIQQIDYDGVWYENATGKLSTEILVFRKQVVADDEITAEIENPDRESVEFSESAGWEFIGGSKLESEETGPIVKKGNNFVDVKFENEVEGIFVLGSIVLSEAYPLENAAVYDIDFVVNGVVVTLPSTSASGE